MREEPSPSDPECRDCVRRDKPKSSMSISTDPALDKTSGSPTGSGPGKRGLVFILV